MLYMFILESVELMDTQGFIQRGGKLGFPPQEFEIIILLIIPIN